MQLQSILNSSTNELPGILAGLGIREPPEIDDDRELGLTWELNDTGIEISFDAALVVAVFFYGHVTGHYQPFKGELPRDLEFTMSHDEVIAKLGEPSRASAVPNIHWIRYDDEDFCTHIEFLADKSSIRMVTIMTPDRAP